MTLFSVTNLRERAVLFGAVRSFFSGRGYLEVETPLRIPAPAPEAHIIPQPAGEWFLQTSPELCMKRLLARGVPRLFQICKCFRREERGRRHLPEFTMLEWYRAGGDYLALMEECEELLGAAAAALGHGPTLPRPGGNIDLTPPWQRLRVEEAFCRYAGMSAAQALAADLFDQLLVEKIEPHLGRERPTFLYDYPAELAALARKRPDNPAVAERFELYIDGVELANGFSELTDPVEQRQRFVAEQQRMAAAGRIPPALPEKFLTELAAMPPAAGIALGLDRLAMLLLNAEDIEAVISFPPEYL